MAEVCKTYEEHNEKITSVKKKLPSGEFIIEAANFFDAFGDSTRLKILFALMNEELCTCDLSKLTNLSVSAVSHQLRLLKDRKIVNYRKEGKNVFYRLDDEHIKEILKIAIRHLGERNVS